MTYVATSPRASDDASMASRIAVHRNRRPAAWHTVEAGAALTDALAGLEGAVLVDSLGAWVAATWDFEVAVDALCQSLALLGERADVVVVSEEVGMSVSPSTEIGNRFRDVLGAVNTAVAAIADRVLFVIAGRVLPLERWPE